MTLCKTQEPYGSAQEVDLGTKRYIPRSLFIDITCSFSVNVDNRGCSYTFVRHHEYSSIGLEILTDSLKLDRNSIHHTQKLLLLNVRRLLMKDRRNKKVIVTVKDLAEKLRNTPEIPPIHFLSWNYLYIRDIDKLQDWILEFSLAFAQFEEEIREKLEEAQRKPSEFSAIQILKEILGINV